MPEFLADPSVLTKEKLKSELIANNVSLPGGEQRKDVYVQLYLQHLTARNPPAAAQPDFSSDEEREPTPIGARGRGAVVGRKATKKTDKLRTEEKDDLDVSELSNEDLQEQLIKYGINPGPIVATTRKLYEKKLLKLMEQGPELKTPMPLPVISSTTENTRQNGNNDSDQYSDNEEDPKTELRLEKREPLKGRMKTPVAVKRRVVEHNQTYSQDGVTETVWTSGSSKSGPLQAFSRESTRVSRRTPRKRVEATAQLPVDDAVISESTPIAETILTASNETLVGSRVPGNFKHATTTLSISEPSDMPRRTPKKPLMTAEVLEKTHTEEPRVERDILKEMFPYEASTPTGISASCRRPIKGAASRPIEHTDFKMDESFFKYAPKYSTSSDIKPEKPSTKKERSVPLWIKILLFVLISVFLFSVYQSMETNQGNPFAKYLSILSQGGDK
ncbi:thymopoietin isoform X1 [Cyrtonyx montezumae]|uniref:thymopoietin isoform X1 n=1 Tax=Cyrtonyx montezumae TaxID=9017 RepID=UPI0032DB4BB2